MNTYRFCFPGHAQMGAGMENLRMPAKAVPRSFCSVRGLNLIGLETGSQSDRGLLWAAKVSKAIVRNKQSGRLECMPGVIYQGRRIGFRSPYTGVRLQEGDAGYDYAHPDDKAPVDDSTTDSEPEVPVADGSSPAADGSSPICVISLNNVLVPGHGHACKGLLEIASCVNWVKLNSDRLERFASSFIVHYYCSQHWSTGCIGCP